MLVADVKSHTLEGSRALCSQSLPMSAALECQRPSLEKASPSQSP